MLSKAARVVALARDPRNYYFYSQRRFLNATVRSRLARIEASRFPSFPSESDQRAEQLLQRGYTDAFELVPADQVNALRERITRLPLHDPNRKYVDFSFRSIPPDTHVAHAREADLARIPGVMDSANDPRTLSTVANVFGCKPTLDCVLSWWSMPGHERPEHAQLFHRDVDSLSFIKLFMYLTDVDEDSGPHVYVGGSHRDNMPGERIRRYTDQEIVSHYGRARVVRFIGPAGTCFLENTFGYHKGALPKDKRRLILQFIYAVHPTPYGPKRPFLKPSDMPAGFDHYVNRLFVA